MQTKTSKVPPIPIPNQDTNPNPTPIPKPGPKPECYERTNAPTDTSESDIKSPSQTTLPETNVSFSIHNSRADRAVDPSREKFMNLFRREDESSDCKVQSKPQCKQAKGAFKCQDIRKFYSFKLQQPPPQSGTIKGRFQY